MVGGTMSSTQSTARRILYDHRPLQLNQDDYDRVCRIPQKKVHNLTLCVSRILFWFIQF